MTPLARRPRVLVVDDLEPLAEAVADTLADAGHDVAVALDCCSARLGLPGVDLLLTDVRLMDGSGLALAAEMLALGRPSVVMSGDVSALDRVAARHLRFTPLAKPFRGADLVRSVDRALSAWPPAWMLSDAQPAAGALTPDEGGDERRASHDPDHPARGCGLRTADRQAGSHPGHGPRHDRRR